MTFSATKQSPWTSDSSPLVAALVLMFVSLAISGCKEPAQISQYDVPKSQSDMDRFAIVGSSAPAKPDFPVPAGWDYAGKGSFGVIHKFSKTVDGDTALASIASLPVAAADWPANVDRWASGQLGITLDAEAIEKRTEEVTIDGSTGTLIVLDDAGSTDGKATIAAMVVKGKDVWVFKSTGKAAAVKATESEFRDYLKSFKFK